MAFRHKMLVGMLLVSTLAGCGSDEHDSEKVQVVATIFPLADIVRQVGGDYVQVETLLGPGQTPHGFSLKASHIKTLSRSDMLVMMGGGLDPWARGGVQAARRENIHILELAQAVEPGAGGPEHDRDDHAGHDHDGDHDHATDPHLWLDPVFAQQFTARIAEALAQLDPEHALEYRRNATAYIGKLDQLDSEYRRTLANVKHKQLVTLHRAFSYPARRYGLEYKALKGPSGGEYTAGQLSDVTQFIREHDVPAIFIEPQFPADRLGRLADQTGVRIATLDPLGSPGKQGYDSYLAMMRSNLQTMARELGDGQ